ncbi:MAG: hypothetical protein ACE5JU_07370 [Candidatus Binatia bacterium]
MVGKKLTYFGVTFFTLFAFGTSRPIPAASAKTFYEGKSLTFLINYAPGGGTDTFARLVERHIGRYIPGNPGIRFKYVPGGGATIGPTLLFNKSKPNGFVLGVFTGVAAMQATKAPGANFDLNKMRWVVAVGEPSVYFIRTDTAKSVKDFFKPFKKIIMPGLSRNNSKDIGLRLTFDILRVPKENYKYVTGYKGSGPVSLALRSGEASYWGASLTSYGGRHRSLTEEGIITPPLFQTGKLQPDGTIIRDPRIPNLPTLGEVYQDLYGRPHPTGPAWEAWKWQVGTRVLIRTAMFPPGTPDEPVGLLSEAFQAMEKDERFQADAKKITGARMILVPGKEAKSILPEVATMRPEAQEYIEKLMGIKF